MHLDESRLDDLARRGVDGIAEILRRRPDLAEPPPQSLVELVVRMDRPASVRRVLDQLPAPAAQVLAAACSLDSLTLSQLRRHFAADPLRHLRDLHATGLLELDEDNDQLIVADGVLDLAADPLHLGPNLFEIAANVPPEFVRAAAQALWCGTTSSGRDSLLALADAYADGDRVRRTVDALPPEIASWLRQAAADDHVPEHPGLLSAAASTDWPAEAAMAAGRRRGLYVVLEQGPDPRA